MFVSKHHPFPVIRNQQMPKVLNRASWKSFHLADRLNITRILNRYRRRVHLAPLSSALDSILGDHTIAACDRAIAPVPDDVFQKVTHTGYLHLDLQTHLDDRLTRFVLKEPPVVYAGFGSMPPKDQEKKIPMLIRAARDAGCRMVINAFWQDENEMPQAQDIFYVRQVPHRLLFPLLDLIIHHGGAGTTATAALSGRPQIIVPHILDQYYHGQKLFEAGISPRPIPLGRLNRRSLTAAMRTALSDQKMKAMAQETAMSIDPERSLTLTIRALENI